ncbi:MAG TPA: M14 family metallopeptidase [Pyrinomonadaceae bacterium]|nr:M14 family metallopeptidase [Pyrinomonadaceae bacterium]
MQRVKPVFVISIFFLLALTANTAAQQVSDDKLKSRAELTGYEETTRYEEVLNFIAELQKQSSLIRLESFGKSEEGRSLPLMILSDSAISNPREARGSGKPIVFIMANIHAGEVEGKEAMLHLSRRILFGDLKQLLGKLIILIAPIYNADGNEKISINNRTAQNGPIAGVGVRENSKSYDLNRDYMKLDSAEARALVNLLNRWDPHLTVDLHTTNGSYHGYHLTYSQPLNPNASAAIIGYHRDKMLPAITIAMLKNHRLRTYYYGNFPRFTNLPAPGEPTRWEAFTHQPRIGQNYHGLRNRLTILSEAYSYLTFKRRVEVTEKFVEEIFKYAAANAGEIFQLTKRADDETVRKFSGGETVAQGVEFEMRPLPKPVDILIGEVVKVKNPRSGKEMTAMVEEKFKPLRMNDYGIFAAKRSVIAPRAYIFKPEKNLEVVIEKLVQHGITVEELTSPRQIEVDVLTIGNVTRSQRTFQNHREMKVTGAYKTENMTFPTGSIIVRTAQPLGRLVCYLLEAESDDGLVNWNFFDSYLETGKTFPVYKIMRNVNVASRILEKH